MTTQGVTDRQAPWIPTDATFGARLAMIRHARQWNLKEAAAACGVPHTSWRQWELDGMEPRRITAIARQIAGAAGCDYLWLLLGPERSDGPEPTDRDLRRDPRIDPLAPRVVAPAGRASRPWGPVEATRPLAARQLV